MPLTVQAMQKLPLNLKLSLTVQLMDQKVSGPAVGPQRYRPQSYELPNNPDHTQLLLPHNLWLSTVQRYELQTAAFFKGYMYVTLRFHQH